MVEFFCAAARNTSRMKTPKPIWSRWAAFSDPRKQQSLRAPFGPGVYELRRKGTEKPVLVGFGINFAHRMTSLLPAPYGQGTRDNADKREYVLRYIRTIEYRCAACIDESSARALETERRREQKAELTFTT